MRSYCSLLYGSVGLLASGCSNSPSKSEADGESLTTSDAPVTSGTPLPGISTTSRPVNPTIPPNSNCPGKRLGQYSWGTRLWREGATVFSDFFASGDGKEWGCGDITINIGDYSAPDVIAYSQDLVPFIQRYRESSKNYESVVWLTYGDVVSGDGTLMERFIDTFYRWASALTADVANTLGPIGLSFDVEHIDGALTKSALIKAQGLKATTNFAPGKLLIQHTIEGRPNPEGTDAVMRYADSSLIMLYRNYMQSSTFAADSNILSRASYFLKQQCVNCLNDAYATANYKAKITIMVEGSCSPADYCGKISFCAHDSPNEGASYLWNTLQDLKASMFSSGLLTTAQFNRLFNPLTTFAVHDWSWFRCYSPLTSSAGASQCQGYRNAAETCRNTLGTIPTSNP